MIKLWALDNVSPETRYDRFFITGPPLNSMFLLLSSCPVHSFTLSFDYSTNVTMDMRSANVAQDLFQYWFYAVEPWRPLISNWVVGCPASMRANSEGS